MAKDKKYIIKATKDYIKINNASLFDMTSIAIKILQRVAKGCGGKFIAHQEGMNFHVEIRVDKEEKQNASE